MSDQNAQTQGGYPPVPQPVRHPNAGCALAAACAALILSVLVLSNFVFVSQEQRLVEPGILFPKYETVAVTSWLPVIFWTAIFCGIVYALVLWKRSKPFIWLAMAIFIWKKTWLDAQRSANSTKPIVPSYQSR
ncbi:hypothetical protein [Prosthecobacter vanneervenii]|uniref:Uncharacterized protein n=1 Tax=Prosthecobacter vanneervenii TaxID=48466 RepID=A0A7W8DL84_9BACT|nr:hypothetical protein [Prosthecobacter vanneervenii]MBB5033755.1 hypothetical protein [Prosthecobacter vanneervenii]